MIRYISRLVEGGAEVNGPVEEVYPGAEVIAYNHTDTPIPGTIVSVGEPREHGGRMYVTGRMKLDPAYEDD